MRGLKRQRGLRRYYKNLPIVNDLDGMNESDFNGAEAWFDYWHLHFDNYGHGNNSFKRRKPHLDKLFRHFDLLVEKTKSMRTDFQLYAILLDHNSHSDALFLHTPNPNNGQFPFQVSDLNTVTTLKNNALNDYLAALTDYEKRYGIADEAFCLLFKKDIGKPLIW